jgi:hypothetical protein
VVDEPNDTSNWDHLLGEVGVHMELLFILNSRRDKEVWQYIVGVAAHLEYLAVAILWVHGGKPGASRTTRTTSPSDRPSARLSGRVSSPQPLSTRPAPSTDSGTRLLIGEQYLA